MAVSELPELKSDLEKESDENLMVRSGKGDAQAFQSLYQKYKRPLFYFFYRSLGADREKCEDFLQDLFMKLIDKPEYYDPSRPFRPWLYSLAHNMVKNEYKKLEVRKILVKGADTSKVKMNGKSVDHNTDEQLFREKLFQCLEEFHPDNKSAFIMKYHEGFSIEEIADTLGLKEGTVKSKLFYTKKELAEKLAEFNPKSK